jgi:hypothetical protein
LGGTASGTILFKDYNSMLAAALILLYDAKQAAAAGSIMMFIGLFGWWQRN